MTDFILVKMICSLFLIVLWFYCLDFSRSFTVLKYICVFGMIWLLFVFLRKQISSRTLIRKKLHQRSLEMAKHSKQIDPNLELLIKGKDACQLLKLLHSKSISSEALTQFFISKAISANARLECLADINFDAALEQARNLDQHLKETGSVVGPLHGLPISIKDCFDLKGTDTTSGLAQRLFHPASEDAALIRLLKHLGAIPFVKTNCMQVLMGFESVNPIWGRVHNPLDETRTSGGSSGGESALIAAGASPLGIGTDIGGSIRMPAAFTGLFGFKPTSKRIPHIGWDWGLFQDCIGDTFGPLGHSVDDLILLTRQIFNHHNFFGDLNVPPLPFNDQLIQKSIIRVGYYWDDGVNESVWKPLIQNVIQQLEKLPNVELHKILLPPLVSAHELYLSLMSGDGGGSIKAAATSSPLEPEIFSATLDFLPDILRFAIQKALSGTSYEKLGRVIKISGKKDTTEYWAAQRLRRDFQQQMAEHWKGVDILLCPPFPSVAPPHKTQLLSTPYPISYTSLFNLLDYPAGVVPLPQFSHLPLPSRSVNSFIDRILLASEQSFSGSIPPSIQVVGKPFQDELVLNFMQLLSQNIQ